MWQPRIFLCKIRDEVKISGKSTSFQNDKPFRGNRQEIILIGAQKGLWGGRRGSVAN